MLCCGNCFADRFLNQYISTSTKKTSNCSFCKSKNIPCISPSKLSYLFLPVIDLYKKTRKKRGKPIWQLLNDDWFVFGDMDSKTCSKLINKIFPNDENLSKDKFITKFEPSLQKIDKWDEFKTELKHENRYFPRKSPSIEDLKNLFGFLVLPEEELPESYYRSRISVGSKLLPIKKMGKPPLRTVGNGRANPVGISYLYTSTNPETAIAEIRPHVGDKICVAKFEAKRSLTFADLRNPRKTISPFEIEEDDLEMLLTHLEYLCRLGEELSKPIIPREANLEYLPSQYLSEMIKHFKYDGVIYKSSVGGGDNFAVFNGSKLKGIEVYMYQITSSNYESKKIL